MKKNNLYLLVTLFLYVSMANAQIYKDTIWVPVTFYDFHSNKSNPEFEVTPYPITGGVHKNMVGQKLDSEGKPVLGTTPYVNQYIKYWFRPWAGNAGSSIHVKGDSTIPVYDVNNNFVDIAKVNTDTAFKNIVIHDSLPFIPIPNSGGMYQYNNQAFFPLDSRGFGNEVRPHNYSFTMELKWPFQKKNGQTFDFTGDDDVWAFVNGQLAMDLGGIHGPMSGQFTMDEFPVIPYSTVCTLSVFYAERHTDESDIKITTNMISPKLTDPFIPQVQPDSNICLGDSVTVSARIVRGNEVLTQIPAGYFFTWSLKDSSNPPTTLTKTGLKCKFFPIKASTAKIAGTLYDSINNISIADTVTINVKLCIGPPDYIWKLFNAPGDPSSMTPLPDTITVKGGISQTLYIKFFDSKQTWIYDSEQVDSLSKLIKWTLSDTLGAQILSEGSKVTFTSSVAYKNYVLTATYASGATRLSFNVVIKVIPWEIPMFLYIEPNSEGKTLSPNIPQHFPNETIYMGSDEAVRSAYAVIRDIYGNYVRFSNPADWSIDNPIASLIKGDTTRGEVMIKRIDSSGLTKLHVTDKKTGLQAWANLRIENYFYSYTEIKIAVKQNIAGKDSLIPIDSLIMPTDKDSTLYVIGKRSDTGNWDPAIAKWETSFSLVGGINVVNNVSSMKVSSTDTGTGWVRVAKRNEVFTTSDTVFVKFMSGKSDVKYANGRGSNFKPSNLTCKLNGSKLILYSPEKYVGFDVMISDISGRTIDKFVIENTMIKRIIGSKTAGTKSGLYIITVKGKPGRIVVPLKIGN